MMTANQSSDARLVGSATNAVTFRAAAVSSDATQATAREQVQGTAEDVAALRLASTKKRRPWSWIIAIIVLAGAVIGTAVFAGVTYRSASDWKAQAQKTGHRLAATQQSLRSSEADAKQLQSRIDSLASEKAAAEDDKTVAQRIAALAGAAAVDGQACQDAINTFLSGLSIALASRYSSTAGLQVLVDNADTACTKSSQSYNTFVNAVNGL